jgi:TatD DNase family protein
MISSTLAFIAQVKGLSAEELAHITAQNARRLFGIKENLS